MPCILLALWVPLRPPACSAGRRRAPRSSIEQATRLIYLILNPIPLAYAVSDGWQ